MYVYVASADFKDSHQFMWITFDFAADVNVGLKGGNLEYH